MDLDPAVSPDVHTYGLFLLSCSKRRCPYMHGLTNYSKQHYDRTFKEMEPFNSLAVTHMHNTVSVQLNTLQVNFQQCLSCFTARKQELEFVQMWFSNQNICFKFLSIVAHHHVAFEGRSLQQRLTCVPVDICIQTTAIKPTRSNLYQHFKMYTKSAESPKLHQKRDFFMTLQNSNYR